LEHHSSPYLTQPFFEQIGQTMPENLVMFVAYIGDEPVASSLCIYDTQTLHGRYWGSTQYVDSLHFELCYYQAQTFCIQQNIRFFEGGAQGEHKLGRGFVPRPTCSFHKIAHPDFEKAISDFVLRESPSVQAYTDALEERVPYKP